MYGIVAYPSHPPSKFKEENAREYHKQIQHTQWVSLCHPKAPAQPHNNNNDLEPA